jgi:hypothetical protein
MEWVDSGFKDDVAIHGIDVEVVKRRDTVTGFVPQKRRWEQFMDPTPGPGL